jgi:hypothetical protein
MMRDNDPFDPDILEILAKKLYLRFVTEMPDGDYKQLRDFISKAKFE